MDGKLSVCSIRKGRLEGDRTTLVTRNICSTRPSLEYMKRAYLDLGPIVSPLRKPTYSREQDEKHTHYQLLVVSEQFHFLQ
jgi:hypothetical protein